MNKKGFTILELLISITVISIVVLLLVKILFSLENINNDRSYASNDEIARTEIIKNIENDFLKLKLMGLEIQELNEKTKVIFSYQDLIKELNIYDTYLEYDKEIYRLNSKNATYNKCLDYSYIELENNYYLLKISIPVLINKEDTTINDNLILTYLSLKDNNNFPSNYTCLNN